MLNRMTLHFYIRVCPNPKKLSSLYLRITLNSVRIYDKSIGAQIHASKWDQLTQLAKGSMQDAIRLNQLISMIRDKLEKYRNKCYEQQRPMSPNILRHIIAKPFATSSFLEVYKEYLESGDHAVKSAGTRKTYESRYNTIERYLKENKKTDLICEDFNRSECKKFKAWLGGTEVYYVKIMQVVRLILNFAVEEGYIEASPLATLRLGYKYSKKLVFLTLDELERVENALIVNRAIDRVREFYLFACYTGLAYSDLKKFQPYMIEYIAGKPVFRMSRTKTETEAFIPITDKALAIIEKYPKGFLVPANHKMNLYVKVIAAAADIPKPLTVHTARKTFAMTALNEWKMSMESVAKMMGHRNIRELYAYARVEEKRVLAEFESISQL